MEAALQERLDLAHGALELAVLGGDDGPGVAGELQRLAGGRKEVEVKAASYRQLLKALDARFPGVGDRLREGGAVPIDGEIFQEPFLESIGEDREVFFLPRIEAG